MLDTDDDVSVRLVQMASEMMFHGGHMDAFMDEARSPLVQRFVNGEEAVISFVQHEAGKAGKGHVFGETPRGDFDAPEHTWFPSGGQTPVSPGPASPLSTTLANVARAAGKFAAAKAQPHFHIRAGLPAHNEPIEKICIMRNSIPGERVDDVREVLMMLMYHPTFEGLAQVITEFGCQPVADSLRAVADAEKHTHAEITTPVQPWLSGGHSPSEADLAEYFTSWDALLHRIDPLTTAQAGAGDGPLAELEEWRTFSSRAETLVGDLEQPIVEKALDALVDRNVADTFTANVKRFLQHRKEVRDASKNLGVVQPQLHLLYCADTDAVAAMLPNLTRNLLFLRQLSAHYSQPENITRLLLRVSRQLAVHLKLSIGAEEDSGVLWTKSTTEDGLQSILHWCEQVRELEKLYKTALQEGQHDNKDLRMMDVVVPLEAFARRVLQLERVFKTLRELNQLNRWQIPEAGSLAARFSKIMAKYQAYEVDTFDLDSGEAWTAFSELHQAMVGLDNALRVIINNAFERTTDPNKSSLLAKTFSNILAPSITAKKHLIILEHFAAEMVKLNKLFQQTRQRPPAFRNALPITAAIGWARLLRRRVEDGSREVLELPCPESGQRLWRQANLEFERVHTLLLEYEKSHLDKWGARVVKGLAQLRKPPILMWSDGLTLVIDDAFFREVVAVKQLLHLGVDLPPHIISALDLISATKNNVALLEGLTKQYTRILTDIPPHLRHAFAPLINEVTSKLYPGLTGIITWSPIIVEPFIKGVDKAIQNLVWVSDQVRVVLRDWLAHACTCAREADLIDLSGLPYSVDAFTEAQLEYIKKVPHLVKIWNNLVEQGCLTMLDFLPKASRTTKSKLFKYFHSQFCSEVIAATVRSLNTLQGLISHYNTTFLVNRQQPLFILELQITNIGIDVDPPVTKVHEAVVQCCAGIIGITRTLKPWGSEPECSVFNKIRNSKEILKCLFTVTGLCTELNPRIERYVRRYENFEPLWKMNKRDAVTAFVQKTKKKRGRALEEYKERIEKYQSMGAEIDALPDTSLVLPFQLDLKHFKSTLREHAKEWVHCYAQPLHVAAKERLDKLATQFEGLEKRIDTSNASTADLAAIIVALNEHRQLSASLYHLINPIIEEYAYLQTLSYPLPPAEIYQVADLKYRWKTLQELAGKSLVYVHKVQSFHRRDLIVDMQGFRIEVIVFNNRFQEWIGCLDQQEGRIQPKDILRDLSVYRKQLAALCDRCFRQHRDAVMFAIPFVRNPMLEACDQQSLDIHALYTLKIDVDDAQGAFSETMWVSLNMEQVEKTLGKLEMRFTALAVSLSERAVYRELQSTIGRLLEHLPLFKMLHKPCILQRHWRKLMALCNQQWSLAPGVFRARDLLNAGLVEVRESVEGLLLAATKEANIEKQLSDIITPWRTRQFAFTVHPKGWGTAFDAHDAHTLSEQLEENQMLLARLLSCGHVDAFRADATQWMYKLAAASDAIALILDVQKVWTYMDVMFSNRTVVAQLPHDGGRFAMIDEQWQKIISRAQSSESVVAFCNGTDLAVLPTFRDHLYESQLKLQRFLDEKRNAFPRLYLVSDAVLMDILTHAPRPAELNRLLGEVFEGLAALEIEATVQGRTVNEVVSVHLTHDEVPVRLAKRLKCDAPVEKWLAALRPLLQASMLEELKNVAGELLAGNVPDHVQIVKELPMHLNILLLWLHWTMDVSQFLVAQKGDHKKDDCSRRWRGFIAHLLDGNKVTPLASAKASTARTSLLMWAVQLSRQQSALMKSKDVLSTQWEWIRFMRMYWRSDGNACLVRMVDTEVTYGFDVFSHKARLVISPSVERCFIMMLQALHAHACGAVLGPGTSGKTSVVKELGSVCGRFVCMMSCSSTSTVQGLAATLRGLTLSGDWGCIDNLHCVDTAVLSVISVHINCIMSAQKKRMLEFVYTDGTVIKLHGSVGIFTTFLADDAAQRTIPESLRQAFREAALPLPDIRDIVQTKLTALGVGSAADLAYRLDLLLKLLEWRFHSAERGYVFDLRTAILILKRFTTALQLKQSTDAGGAHTTAPYRHSPHHMHLVGAIRDSITPALLPNDVASFTAIFDSIFSDTSAHPPEREVMEALENACGPGAAVAWSQAWVAKAVQLYRATKDEFSCVLCGPPSAGKTTLLRALLRTLRNLSTTRQREQRIHPHSVTVAQLYGAFDARGAWTDGLLSSIWATASEEAKWLVLDGPLTGPWVDGFKALLDDALTLANGDRLRLNVAPHAVHCLMETVDLASVTPGVLSRLSVVHVGGDEVTLAQKLGVFLLTHVASQASALEGLAPAVVHQLEQLFAEHADALAAMVAELPKAVAPATVADILLPTVAICCKVLEGLKRVTKDEDVLCERVFWMQLSSAYGALANVRLRYQLQTYIAKHASLNAIPDGNVYDFYVDANDGQCYRIEPQVYDCGTVGCAPFCPTRTGEALLRYMQRAVKCGVPTLCVGGRGVGKTRLMTCVLQTQAERDPSVSFHRIGLRAGSTAPSLRTRISAQVGRQVGSVHGPRFEERMYIFLDDLALPGPGPSVDGETSAAELVRQMLELHGDWSPHSNHVSLWRNFNRITFVAAADVEPAIPISQRLRRHFVYVSYGQLEFDQLKAVAATAFPAVDDLLVKPTWDLWMQCAERLPRQDVVGMAGMVFTLRDVFTILAGVVLVPQYESSVPLWKYECCRVLGDRLGDAGELKWFEKQVAIATQGITEAKYHRDGLRDDEESFENYYMVPSAAAAASPRTETGSIASPLRSLLSAGNLPLPRAVRTAGSMAPVTPSPRRSRLIATGNSSSSLTGVAGMASVQLFFKNKTSAKAAAYRSYSYTDLLAACEGALTELGGLRSYVLFEAMCVQVARIARVLSTQNERGLVLVGNPACGKHSATKLAAKLLKLTFTEIRPVPGTPVEEQLKVVLQAAASRGPQVVYIGEGTATQPCAETTLLEAVQNLVTDRELPVDLADQWDNLPEQVVQEMAGARDTPDEVKIWEWVRTAVLANFRPVVAIAPAAAQDGTFFKRYRSLAALCCVNWMLPWPEFGYAAVFNALVSPALCHSESSGLALDDTTQREPVAKLACAMHTAASTLLSDTTVLTACHAGAGQVTTVTVRRFLRLFRQLYKAKVDRAMSYARQADVCMRRYSEASSDVARIYGTVGQNEKQSRETQQQQAVYMSELYEINSQVLEKKQRLIAYREELAAKAAMVEKYRQILQGEIKLTQPALDAGKRICDAVTSQDLKFLRSIPFPIPVVRKVFDLLLVLLHHPLNDVRLDETSSKAKIVMGDSWLPSGRALAHRPDVMSVLNHFHALCRDSINDETVEFLEAYFAADEDLDSVPRMKKMAGNIGALVQWVKVMIEYHATARTVEGKITQVREAEAEMRQSNLRLQRAQEDFEVLSVDVRKIESQIEEQRSLQQHHEEEAVRLKLQANAASSLVECLCAEHEQWLEVSAQHLTRLRRLPGECLFEAAVYTYTAHLAQDARQRVIDGIYKTVPAGQMKPLDDCLAMLTTSQGTEEDVSLALHHLPDVPQHVFNARVVHHMGSVKRWCLLIDPDGIGLRWLVPYTKRAKPHRLCKVIPVHASGFLDELIDCMEGGAAAVVTDVTKDLDPDLDGLLYSHWSKPSLPGGPPTVMVNGRAREILPGFELFLICRRPDELAMSESAKQNLVFVDFRPPPAGLQRLFLKSFLAAERADLEEAQVELLEQRNENQTKVIELKKSLMKTLSTVCTDTVPLIENEDAIASMFEINRADTDAKKQLARIAVALVKVQNLGNEFIDIAQAACQVYTQAQAWEKSNPYVSLSVYQTLAFIDQSAKLAERHDIPAKRVALVVNAFQYLVYRHFARGVFPEQRLPFKVLFLAYFGVSNWLSKEACDILERIPYFQLAQSDAQRQRQQAVYEALLAEAAKSISSFHFPHWVTHPMRCKCVFVMDLLPLFRRVMMNLERDKEEWRRWLEADDPDSTAFPKETFGPQGEFSYLLAVFCFHSDASFSKAVASFIAACPETFVNAQVTHNVGDAIQQTTPFVPVLYVTRTGACVEHHVDAASRRGGNTLKVIGLGTGSAANAATAVQSALDLGQWVLLQNVQCDRVFVQVLRDLLDAARAAEGGKVKKDARIIMTCKEGADLPRWLLSSSVKVALQQPESCKENMQLILDTVPQDVFTAFKRAEFKTLLYAICVILSLLQRKSAHPRGGFSHRYVFALSQVGSLSLFLQNYFSIIGDWGNRCKPVNLDCVAYMIGHGFLGGQIHSARDREVLNACITTAFRALRATPTASKAKIEIVGGGYDATWDVSMPDVVAMVNALPEDDTVRALCFAAERSKGHHGVHDRDAAGKEKSGKTASARDVRQRKRDDQGAVTPSKPRGAPKPGRPQQHATPQPDDDTHAQGKGRGHRPSAFADVAMDWGGGGDGAATEGEQLRRQQQARNAVPIGHSGGRATNISADGSLMTPIVDLVEMTLGQLKVDFTFVQEACQDEERVVAVPLLDFLCREAMQLMALYTEVRKSATLMLQHLRNGTPLSDLPAALRVMHSDLEKGKAPQQWKTLFPRHTRTIVAQDFHEYIRVQYHQLQAWVAQLLVPGGPWNYPGFWMGGVLDVRGFFVAFLAQCSASARLPFDQIRLVTSVADPDDVTHAATAKDKTLLYGFVLQGGVYDADRKRTVPCFTSDVTPHHYLIFHVAGESGQFTSDTQPRKAAAGAVPTYKCPVHDSYAIDDASLLFTVPLVTNEPDLVASLGMALVIE